MYFDTKSCLANSAIKINYSNIDNNSEYKIFHFDDNIYYYKQFNLNEFIGEELSTIMNARTVHFNFFELTGSDDYSGIVIASKDFKNPNSNYFYKYDLFHSSLPCLETLKNVCVDQNNYNYMLDNIFKMFALDVYMGQNDRHSVNCQIEQYDTKFMDLAHIYDYTECRWDKDLYYVNPFWDFDDIDDYTELFHQYSISLDMFKKITKVNLIEVLKDIQEKHRFQLPSNVFEIYKRCEENAQNKLQKIIK